MNQTEYNILGCTIRVKSDEDKNNKALAAINLLRDEIDKVKEKNSSLKDSDLAVLSALNLASRCLDTEADYKDSVFALKSGIEDALQYVEKVSPGSMQSFS
ncbi:MAG: cell division protein ZapA [Halobacteriovoraceae bacterium]|nr:cell division protein ZapA [Halobacteriovoraceae bacterium]